MSIKEKLCEIKPRETSGASTLNAYSYQIDICGFLILELLKSKKDFLTLVDYLDDIVILDDCNDPQEITFYQVKTSKNEISMTTILNKKWFEYMEENITSFEQFNPKSIFLTNTNIFFPKKTFKTKAQNFVIDSLGIQSLNECLPDDDCVKIKDILKLYIKNEDNYDKIYIHKSKFTLDDHTNQLLAELINFFEMYDPKFDVTALKSVYNEFVVLIKNLSQEKYAPKQITFEELINKKGFKKEMFLNLCNKIKRLMIPSEFKLLYNFSENTLEHDFDNNFIFLTDKFRDFGTKAIINTQSYEKILKKLDMVDLKNCNNKELFDCLKKELENDEEIINMDFYKLYYEFIILVYLYKY